MFKKIKVWWTLTINASQWWSMPIIDSQKEKGKNVNKRNQTEQTLSFYYTIKTAHGLPSGAVLEIAIKLILAVLLLLYC